MVALIEVKRHVDGYTATSSLIPELVTCGETLPELIHNLRDALGAIIDLYTNEELIQEYAQHGKTLGFPELPVE